MFHCELKNVDFTKVNALKCITIDVQKSKIDSFTINTLKQIVKKYELKVVPISYKRGHVKVPEWLVEELKS